MEKGESDPGLRGPAFRLAVTFVLAAAGCGANDDLPLVKVARTVTYAGAPLTHRTVVFAPEASTPGPQAVGRIENDGSFRMEPAEEGGRSEGAFRVTVHCRREPTTEELEKLETPPSLIPIKYSRNEESNLRYQATEEDTDYAIELE